jgi:hypothetical protein
VFLKVLKMGHNGAAMRKLVSLFLALALVFHVIRVQSQRLTEEEEFSEDLLLRPLPDGKVLAHFLFTNLLPPVKSHGHHHHRLFPKAIYQLVRSLALPGYCFAFFWKRCGSCGNTHWCFFALFFHFRVSGFRVLLEFFL